MIQIYTLIINLVNYYLMAATNKQLLIFESRGDSNRCTPCRGKPNQHDMYASHANPRTPGIRFLRVIPACGNLSRVVDRVEQSHCSQEKGLLTQSTARQLTDPWVCTQFVFWANLEAIDTSIRAAFHCHDSHDDLHLRAAAATSTNCTTYVLPIHHHEAADDGGAARRGRPGGNRDGQDVGAYDVPTLKKDS
jgi:hypothetical protein